MGVVEGLTATIAQHNPEVDFQTIWASDSEEGKLDIHYREAITDLESFLSRFTSATSGLFDLQALADDYVITIRTHSNWPPRLSGVLSNQIQNYLVHAVMAGWLSDFPDIKTADFAGMGVKDLDDIKELLLKKDFRFAEEARHQDDSHKQGNGASVGDRSSDAEVKVENGASVGERFSDAEAKVGNGASVGERFSDAEAKVENGASVGERFSDAEVKVENGASVGERFSDAEAKVENSASVGDRFSDAEEKVENGASVGERSSDAEVKAENGAAVGDRSSDAEAKVENGASVGERFSDAEVKVGNTLAAEARNDDRVEKDAGSGVRASGRHEDSATQHFHHDYVDWSGGRPPYELR